MIFFEWNMQTLIKMNVMLSLDLSSQNNNISWEGTCRWLVSGVANRYSNWVYWSHPYAGSVEPRDVPLDNRSIALPATGYRNKQLNQPICRPDPVSDRCHLPKRKHDPVNRKISFVSCWNFFLDDDDDDVLIPLSTLDLTVNSSLPITTKQIRFSR